MARGKQVAIRSGLLELLDRVQAAEHLEDTTETVNWILREWLKEHGFIAGVKGRGIAGEGEGAEPSPVPTLVVTEQPTPEPEPKSSPSGLLGILDNLSGV